MNLLGKRVLITGGTSGLGLALAKLLTSEGARVWGCGHSQESVTEARSMLPISTYSAVVCDVLDYDALKKLVESIGQVDVLINSAGIFLDGLVEDNDVSRISSVIDTNLKGVIYATHAVLKGMKERNEGIIVNVSSTAGLKGKPNQAVYAASKYGVTGFTESLKIDLKGTKVDVLGFYPSKMNTNLMKHSGVNKDTSQWMDPKDVAEVILFMLKRPASMRMDKVVVKRRT